LKHELYQAKR
jgi:hypothetical protein